MYTFKNNLDCFYTEVTKHIYNYASLLMMYIMHDCIYSFVLFWTAKSVIIDINLSQLMVSKYSINLSFVSSASWMIVLNTSVLLDVYDQSHIQWIEHFFYLCLLLMILFFFSKWLFPILKGIICMVKITFGSNILFILIM